MREDVMTTQPQGDLKMLCCWPEDKEARSLRRPEASRSWKTGRNATFLSSLQEACNPANTLMLTP